MGLIKCVCVAIVKKTTPLPKLENFDGLVVILHDKREVGCEGGDVVWRSETCADLAA